jgi:hypothetical protein
MVCGVAKANGIRNEASTRKCGDEGKMDINSGAGNRKDCKRVLRAVQGDLRKNQIDEVSYPCYITL